MNIAELYDHIIQDTYIYIDPDLYQFEGNDLWGAWLENNIFLQKLQTQNSTSFLC